MASVEVLALLCCGSVKYGEIRLSASADSLTRCEISGYLAGLSRPAMLMAQAKYMQDDSALIMLYGYVTAWLYDCNKIEQWGCNVVNDERLSWIAANSLIEVVSPHRCSKCKGTGFKVVKICTCCNGSGFRPISQLAMSQSMGVPETTFRRVWYPRFNRCVEYVREWDADVNRVVSLAIHSGV